MREEEFRRGLAAARARFGSGEMDSADGISSVGLPHDIWARTLFCGSRLWADVFAIDQAIRFLRPYLQVVINGDSRGADRIARRLAIKYEIPVASFPADWDRYRNSAGPIRNERMLREGGPSAVVAFTDDFENPRSGTRHMCRIAVQAGVPTMLVQHGRGRYVVRALGPEDFRTTQR